MYKFYVKMDGQVFGPYSTRDIIELDLPGDVLVREESIAEWNPARFYNFRDLAAAEHCARENETETGCGVFSPTATAGASASFRQGVSSRQPGEWQASRHTAEPDHAVSGEVVSGETISREVVSGEVVSEEAVPGSSAANPFIAGSDPFISGIGPVVSCARSSSSATRSSSSASHPEGSAGRPTSSSAASSGSIAPDNPPLIPSDTSLDNPSDSSSDTSSGHPRIPSSGAASSAGGCSSSFSGSPSSSEPSSSEPSPAGSASHPEGEPLNLHRWSWGGFLLGWIWGFFNGVYWPLVAILLNFIPYIGVPASLLIHLLLGLKGNRYAWAAKSWKSPEAFERTQNNWAKAGAGFFVLALLISILILLYKK